MDKRKYEKYIMLFSTDWCSDRCTFVALVLVVRDRRIWRDVTGGSGSIDSSAGDRWNSSGWFLDTQDALSSYQPMERRLEILKDSHAGAFAIISCSVYFLAYTGIYSMLTAHAAKVIAISFMLSRTLSGLSVICFPQARKKGQGLVATFSESAEKRVNRRTLMIYLIVLSALMIVVGKWSGAAAVIMALLVFWYYHHMSISKSAGSLEIWQGISYKCVKF